MSIGSNFFSDFLGKFFFFLEQQDNKKKTKTRTMETTPIEVLQLAAEEDHLFATRLQEQFDREMAHGLARSTRRNDGQPRLSSHTTTTHNNPHTNTRTRNSSSSSSSSSSSPSSSSHSSSSHVPFGDPSELASVMEALSSDSDADQNSLHTLLRAQHHHDQRRQQSQQQSHQGRAAFAAAVSSDPIHQFLSATMNQRHQSRQEAEEVHSRHRQLQHNQAERQEQLHQQQMARHQQIMQQHHQQHQEQQQQHQHQQQQQQQNSSANSIMQLLAGSLLGGHVHIHTSQQDDGQGGSSTSVRRVVTHRSRTNNNHHIDPTRMTYEQLMALQEAVGSVSQGASDARIDQLPTSQFTSGNTSARRSSGGGGGGSDEKGKVESSGKEGVEIEVEGDDTDNSCSVCMCEFEEGETIRTLPCFHKYHAACIDTWLKQKAQCPVCRAGV